MERARNECEPDDALSMTRLADDSGSHAIDPTVLSAVTDTIPQLVWSALPDGTIDYCNTRWLEYTGLTDDQIRGDGWAAALHPDDRRTTMSAWRRATKTGTEYEVEQRLRRKDGIYRWFLTRALPLRDADDRIVKWYGTCTDIQDHKDIGEALAQIRSRFETIFNAIPDAVIFASTERRIVMVNPAFTDFYGYSEDEVIGRLTEFLYANPEDFHTLSRSFQSAGARGKHYEIQFRKKNGETVWCDTLGTPITDARGNPVGFLGIHRDITAQRDTEASLRRNEDRFRKLADAAPAMVWLTSKTGSCEFLSRAWYEFTGRTEQTGLGAGWLDPIHPGDRADVDRVFRDAIAQVESFQIEYRIRHADGEYRWVIDTGRPRFSADGEFLGHIGSVFDISERKRAEQRVEQSRQTLEALIEVSPLAISVMDVDGRVMLWNTAAVHLFGWPRDEVIGKLPPTVPEHKHNEFRANLRRTMAGEPLRGVESLRWTRDGSPVEVELWSAALRTAEGNPDLIVSIATDIRQRKRAEDDVRRSEQLFRAVFEASGTGMVICDPADGRFIRVNQKYCEITGYTSEELRQLSFAQLTHPTDRGADWGNYRLLVEGILPEYTVEKRYIRKDGRIIWVRVNCVVTRNDDGAAEYDVAVIQDVSEHKAFEQSLRESETRFRSMADNIAQLAWMAQRSGWIFWYNQRWFDYTGTTLKDMEGWGWQKVHHPDHVARVTQKFRHHIRHGIIWEDTFPLRGADGQFRWFLSRAVPIRDERGDVTLWFGTNTDVTEQRAAQEALHASEAEFRALFDLSAVGMFLIEPFSGRITRANPKYAEITGFSIEELRTMSLGDITHEDDRELDQRKFWDAVESGENGWTHEKRYRRKDGAIIWVHISGTIMRDDSGNAYRCMAGVRDITEKKNAEEQLERLNETLELRVRERTAEVYQLAEQLRALASELTRVEQRERKRLARILHDHIQQLLVAAQMQLEWVRRDPASERAEASVRGVVSIIKEAIAASRSLTVELSPPILHEAGLTGGLTWLAARMEEKNQFKVHVRADTHAEPVQEETRFLLFESVRELLFNSLKHSGAAEAFVVMTRTKDMETKIVVEDRGRGFDAHEIRQRPVDSGSFGLFSIQQRLAHIGGSMELEGAVGRGVRVTLRVPLGPAEPAEQRQRVAGHQRAHETNLLVRERSEKIRILLVDDHKILRDGIAGLLQFENDMEVVGEAADGDSAVALAEQLRPDVVIMDVNMPGLNGIEATRILTRDLPDVKIIGLSMHMERDTAALMRDAGAIAYLTKGGPFEDLLDAIRACKS